MRDIRETVEMGPRTRLVVLVSRGDRAGGLPGVTLFVEEGEEKGAGDEVGSRLPTPSEWTHYRPHVLQKLDFHLFGEADALHGCAGLAPLPSPAPAEVVAAAQSEALAPDVPQT